MSQPATPEGGRSRSNRSTTVEDNAIQSLMAKGERDLAERRAARARARMIRLQELQRQKETEERLADAEFAVRQAKKVGIKAPSPKPEKKAELEDVMESLPQDPVQRLEVVNARLNETLLTNSQLHSDKMQLVYELDLLRDRQEDSEQTILELRYDNRLRNQDLAVLRNQTQLCEQQMEQLRREMAARDDYLKEKGLQWPPVKTGEEQEGDSGRASSPTSTTGSVTSAMSTDVSRFSGQSEKATVMTGEERRRRGEKETFSREKQYLLEQIGRLKQEAMMLRNEMKEQAKNAAVSENGPLSGVMRDTTRLVNEYKTKLASAETEKTRLEGQLHRLEAQVKRLKNQQEEWEKLEDELKTERRKLQREVRQAKNQAEELELENERLQKRVETLRKRHQRE